MLMDWWEKIWNFLFSPFSVLVVVCEWCEWILCFFLMTPTFLSVFGFMLFFLPSSFYVKKVCIPNFSKFWELRRHPYSTDSSSASPFLVWRLWLISLVMLDFDHCYSNLTTFCFSFPLRLSKRVFKTSLCADISFLTFPNIYSFSRRIEYLHWQKENK